jgi:hypothetical protein
MSEFKVGDRVVVVAKSVDGKFLKGNEGVITQINKNYGGISVEFDKDIDGHNCGGSTKDNRGWNVKSNDIKLIEQPVPIEATVRSIYLDSDVVKHIQNDGTTIVILDTGEKGVSRLTEGDTYNALKGYKVALMKARIKRAVKSYKQDYNELVKKEKAILRMEEKIVSLMMKV